MFYPAASAMDVPLDARLRGLAVDPVLKQGPEHSRLFGPDGEVPTRRLHLAVSGGEEAWPGDLPLLVPRARLSPNTEYRLEPSPWEGVAQNPTPYTFTTGESADAAPPPAPAVLDIRWANDGEPSECTTGPRLELTLGDVAGLVLIHATPADSRDSGQRSRPREMSWFGSSRVVLGAQELCDLPFEKRGRHIFRIAALGLNGALSDWTEIPGALDVNEPPSEDVLAALPVQGNGPSGFAQPLYREDADGGCTLARAPSGSATRLANGAVPFASLLALLACRAARRARRLRAG